MLALRIKVLTVVGLNLVSHCLHLGSQFTDFSIWATRSAMRKWPNPIIQRGVVDEVKGERLE
jgi:hypothetical protein